MAGEDLRYKPGVIEKAKFEYSSSRKVFNKGLEENDKKEGLLKRLGNIKHANEKQLQTIKDKHLKLVKRNKDSKPKLKSLMYQINKEDKRQLEYFGNLVKIEFNIDYTKLYYQSSNRDKDAFNFNEFGSMIDFYQRLKIGQITFEEAKSRLIKFTSLLDMLTNTSARGKKLYKKSLKPYKMQNYCLKDKNYSIVNLCMKYLIMIIYIRLAEERYFLINTMMKECTRLIII